MREIPKSFRDWKNEKKDNRKLYEHINGMVKLTLQGLQSLYLGSDEFRGDLVYSLTKSVYDLKKITFALLIDEKTAKQILAERR